MAIWVSLNNLSKHNKDILANDLTVIQLDERYEKMKKRGKIIPGYIVDSNSKIACYNIDSEGNLWIPYYYARLKLNIVPELGRYPILNESLKNEIELREKQKEIVELCYEQLITKGCTTIGLPPGFGKTYIGAYLSYYLKLKILVVVPISSVINVWKNTFKASYPDVSVWVIDDEGNIPKEYGGDLEELPIDPPDVTICLDPRLSKIPDKWKYKFGTLIIDEAHLVPTRNRIENLLSIRPAYIITETATMEREDNLHKICHLISGEHGIYRTSSDPYNFNIINIPFVNVKESFNTRGVNYGDVCKSLSLDKVYNRVILNIVKNNPNNKFIILTIRTDHGNLLKELFISNDIEADTFLGSKKSYVNSRVLIGTFKKLGTGFDEATFSKNFKGPKSDSLIICHSVAKNRNFEQFKGRVMRTENPTVYWLNVGNKVIQSHLTSIKKYVKETNGNIINKDGYEYL